MQYAILFSRENTPNADGPILPVPHSTPPLMPVTGPFSHCLPGIAYSLVLFAQDK